MHAASDLIKTALDPQSMKSSKQSPPAKLSQPLLDKLWLKMAELYGRRWTGSFGVSADQSHAWAATLGDLTGEQIAVGLNALACTEDKQLQDWPPAAPQFRALCLSRDPEAFGLPSEDAAFREAFTNAHPAMADIGKWSHQAVFHAAKETGFYNLNTLRTQDSRKLFARNYAIACRMVMAGEVLAEIPLALPAEVTGCRTEAVGRAALAGLRQKLGAQA